MSSKQFNKIITSTTEPINGLVGDEWFNPITNKLYKYLPTNRLAPTWCEIPQTATPNNLSLSNVVSNGTATFTGSSTNLAMNATNFVETVALAGIAPAPHLNYAVTSQTILYVTANSTNNININITGNDYTPLNNILNIGQSVSCALLLTNSATAYYITAIRVDGVTPALVKWQNGTIPTSGNTNSIDSYTFSVIKTGNATFTVLAGQSKFA